MQNIDDKHDLFSLLRGVVENDPKANIEYRIESLRLMLSESLRKTRISSGMSQGALAIALGVKQPWVSKLESPNNDHTFESIARYLFALGADVSLNSISNGITIDIASSNNDGAPKFKAGILPSFITQEDEMPECPRENRLHWTKMKAHETRDNKNIWVIPNVA